VENQQVFKEWGAHVKRRKKALVGGRVEMWGLRYEETGNRTTCKCSHPPNPNRKIGGHMEVDKHGHENNS